MTLLCKLCREGLFYLNELPMCLEEDADLHKDLHTYLNAGDMDLDPVTGQYRFTASVPSVEMNDLRRTLGIKPLPMPIGGALRGVLHCTGALEQPVFSGLTCQRHIV